MSIEPISSSPVAPVAGLPDQVEKALHLQNHKEIHQIIESVGEKLKAKGAVSLKDRVSIQKKYEVESDHFNQTHNWISKVWSKLLYSLGFHSDYDVIGELQVYSNCLEKKALFQEAVKDGDVASTKDLLERGINPNTPLEDGQMPIAFAAEKGNAALVAVLIGNNYNVTGEMIIALINKEPQPANLAEVLVPMMKANPNIYALGLLYEKNRLDVMDALVQDEALLYKILGNFVYQYNQSEKVEKALQYVISKMTTAQVTSPKFGEVYKTALKNAESDSIPLKLLVGKYHGEAQKRMAQIGEAAFKEEINKPNACTYGRVSDGFFIKLIKSEQHQSLESIKVFLPYAGSYLVDINQSDKLEIAITSKLDSDRYYDQGKEVKYQKLACMLKLGLQPKFIYFFEVMKNPPKNIKELINAGLTKGYKDKEWYTWGHHSGFSYVPQRLGSNGYEDDYSNTITSSGYDYRKNIDKKEVQSELNNFFFFATLKTTKAEREELLLKIHEDSGMDLTGHFSEFKEVQVTHSPLWPEAQAGHVADVKGLIQKGEKVSPEFIHHFIKSPSKPQFAGVLAELIKANETINKIDLLNALKAAGKLEAALPTLSSDPAILYGLLGAIVQDKSPHPEALKLLLTHMPTAQVTSKEFGGIYKGALKNQQHADHVGLIIEKYHSEAQKKIAEMGAEAFKQELKKDGASQYGRVTQNELGELVTNGQEAHIKKFYPYAGTYLVDLSSSYQLEKLIATSFFDAHGSKLHLPLMLTLGMKPSFPLFYLAFDHGKEAELDPLRLALIKDGLAKAGKDGDKMVCIPTEIKGKIEVNFRNYVDRDKENLENNLKEFFTRLKSEKPDEYNQVAAKFKNDSGWDLT